MVIIESNQHGRQVDAAQCIDGDRNLVRTENCAAKLLQAKAAGWKHVNGIVR
jgi:hypothetical protein